MLKHLSPEKLQDKFKQDMTRYIESLLTKSSSTAMGNKSTQLKKSMLKAIQRSDQTSDKVSVKDIATYISKDLKSGW